MKHLLTFIFYSIISVADDHRTLCLISYVNRQRTPLGEAECFMWQHVEFLG